MSILDGDGHLTSVEFEHAPTVYFKHCNARIAVAADNQWVDALRLIGAVEVSKAEYERADALKRGEHEI